MEIDIVFAAQVAEAEKLGLVRELGEVMGEPSVAGRYRVRLADADTERAEEIVARLRADPRVRLAARVYSGEQDP